MSKRVWVSIGAALPVLVLVGMLTTGSDARFTVTTLGQLPGGYGALFDLFADLGLPVARSYVAGGDLPSAATVWWIRPAGVCAAPASDTPAADERGTRPILAAQRTWDGRAWIESGGTAVILLPQTGSEIACASIAGLAVPRQLRPRAHGGDAEVDAIDAKRAVRRPAAHSAEASQTQVVDGPVVARPRQLGGQGFSTFESAGAWHVSARLDGQPFVLEQVVGGGRLVLVADARVLSNAWLATADAAPLALDLARAFGVPRFDERAHGLRAEESTVRYLAGSPAVFVFVGLALLGGVFAWRGSAWPARTLGAADVGAPTLETFVDSLADLYARTRDHGRVLQRYRDLSLARLRRHFGLPPDTPARVLIERVRGTRRVQSELLPLLTSDTPVRTEAALRAQVRALDRVVQEATR